MDDGETVEVGDRFPGPFEVRCQDEACLRVRVLEYDPVRLLLVLQHVVHPLEGELLLLEVRQRHGEVEARRLPDQVARRAQVLVYVLLRGGVHQVQLDWVVLCWGLDAVLSVYIIVKLLDGFGLLTQ